MGKLIMMISHRHAGVSDWHTPKDCNSSWGKRWLTDSPVDFGWFWVCPMFKHSMYWAIPTLMPGSWKLLLLEANAKNVPWSLAILGWGITPSSYISPTYPSIYPEISEWHVKCGVGWTSLLTTVGKGPLFLRGGLSIRLLYIYVCVCVCLCACADICICIYIYICVCVYVCAKR